MSFSWKIIAIVLSALVAIELFYLHQENERVQSLRDLLSDTYAVSLSLEQEIGYGGLIHNFKNYILRPGEQKYYDAARQNAAYAATLIDSLEENAESLGVMLELNETRNMVEAYNNRLDTVSTLVASGGTPKDIDMVVRYKDDYALSEVKVTATAIVNIVNERLAELAKRSQLQLQLIFALIAFGVLYFCVTLNGLTNRSAKIKSANNALKSSNDELSRSNLALQQFAGIASHDLKSPVRHIALLSDMMALDLDDPEKLRAHAANIRGAAGRMDQLIGSLLDFSKTGFAKPNIVAIDSSGIVADAIADLAIDIDAQDAKISVNNNAKIKADPELMKRVFQNLIGNSLKYAQKDRTPDIIIDCETSNGLTMFSISDNGIGVDRDHAEKIFEPMQRLHGRNSEYPGVGIGLSLVKAIVESHGGKVWLDSEYENGARFCFTIPAADASKSGDRI